MPLYTETESQLYLKSCEEKRMALAQMVLGELKQSFAQFWDDPVAKALLLGTKAQEAFGIHQTTGVFIATVAPELAGEIPRIDTEKWVLTWNQDGSLTVVEIPEPEPEPVDAPVEGDDESAE